MTIDIRTQFLLLLLVSRITNAISALFSNYEQHGSQHRQFRPHTRIEGKRTSIVIADDRVS